MRLEYAMPRRKKEPWDTPEIQALGAGFARQGYFRKGYGEAQGEANAFAINATAVVGKVKPQIAFLSAIHGNYGEAGGKFLQPISIPKVISATGIKNAYYVNQAFDAGRTKKKARRISLFLLCRAALRWCAAWRRLGDHAREGFFPGSLHGGVIAATWKLCLQDRVFGVVYVFSRLGRQS